MQTKSDAEKVTAQDCHTVREDDQFSGKSVGRFEYEIGQTSTLVHEAIAHLSRHCPDHAIGGAALESLQRMRPHLEEALSALAEIERRRGLTQKELSHRRAFAMLLEGARI